jgi:hypothetical protein
VPVPNAGASSGSPAGKTPDPGGTPAP